MRPTGNEAGLKAKSASALRPKRRGVSYVRPIQCVSTGRSACACPAGPMSGMAPAAEAGRNGDPVTNIANPLGRSTGPLSRAKRLTTPLGPRRAGSERQQNAAGCTQRSHAPKGIPAWRGRFRAVDVVELTNIATNAMSNGKELAMKSLSEFRLSEPGAVTERPVCGEA
jgi:hypothetical protein